VACKDPKQYLVVSRGMILLSSTVFFFFLASLFVFLYAQMFDLYLIVPSLVSVAVSALAVLRISTVLDEISKECSLSPVVRNYRFLLLFSAQTVISLKLLGEIVSKFPASSVLFVLVFYLLYRNLSN